MKESGNRRPWSPAIARRGMATVPKISALIRTRNDAARIGRALDSLRPCDEVLVIDDRSEDRTRELARAHGATVKEGQAGIPPETYLAEAHHDWIFCLRPTEALSEALEASLFLWKENDPGPAKGYSVGVREESESGWKTCPAEMRLVNRHRNHWLGDLPPNDPGATALVGDLLRFRNP